MQHLRPEWEARALNVDQDCFHNSNLRLPLSSRTASCVFVVLPPRFLSFRCILSTDRLLGTLLKRFCRSESSPLHFYGVSRQTWDQFKSVYTVELIPWLQLKWCESTLFRINDMVWLIERVLLCRWVRGGSKPAPTFLNVRSPCTPPSGSPGSHSRQSGSSILSSAAGGSPWWAYPNGEWFLGAQAHSSAWNHRAGGGTHVFINTVRAQIMSHCKILILAGVLYCLVEIQAGK